LSICAFVACQAGTLWVTEEIDGASSIFRIAGGSLLRCADLRFSSIAILSPEVIGAITAVGADLVDAHSTVCTWLRSTFVDVVAAVVAVPTRGTTTAVVAYEVSASAAVQTRITGAFIKVDLALFADISQSTRTRV
jgi:hypothetical protein